MKNFTKIFGVMIVALLFISVQEGQAQHKYQFDVHFIKDVESGDCEPYIIVGLQDGANTKSKVLNDKSMSKGSKLSFIMDLKSLPTRVALHEEDTFTDDEHGSVIISSSEPRHDGIYKFKGVKVYEDYTKSDDYWYVTVKKL